jgi:hypothetical protein
VLFPTGDDGELIHALDRFCTREKEGSLLHFRITQDGVVRALRGGLGSTDLLRRRRVPRAHAGPAERGVLAQGLGLRAGLMRLAPEPAATCRGAGRAAALPARTRARAGHLAEVLDARTVRLKGRVTPRACRRSCASSATSWSSAKPVA